MEKDPFEEYFRVVEPGQKELGYAWQTGVGLQAVDQLRPSKYLLDTARKNIEGQITLERASELIESYYRESSPVHSSRTEEADKVAVRIAQILSEKSFVFSPAQYLAIHQRLFHGIYFPCRNNSGLQHHQKGVGSGRRHRSLRRNLGASSHFGI